MVLFKNMISHNEQHLFGLCVMKRNDAALTVVRPFCSVIQAKGCILLASAKRKTPV